MLKKIITCACLMVLTFSIAGCASTPSSAVKPPEPQTVAPKAEELNADLIKISELTIKPQDGIVTEVIGTATNDNKMECNFDIEVFFFNPDGTPMTSEVFQITDIKAGETKYFTGMVMEKDISKTTHKVQFGHFFNYTK